VPTTILSLIALRWALYPRGATERRFLADAQSASDTLTGVAELQKRGSYTPRRVREQRAYRLVVSGSVAGLVGVVTLVLAIAGIVSGTIPTIALIVAALCAWGFSRTVSGR
jgi:hypothetical protein